MQILKRLNNKALLPYDVYIGLYKNGQIEKHLIAQCFTKQDVESIKVDCIRAAIALGYNPNKISIKHTTINAIVEHECLALLKGKKETSVIGKVKIREYNTLIGKELDDDI